MRVFALSWLLAVVVVLGATSIPATKVLVLIGLVLVIVAWRWCVARPVIAGVCAGCFSVSFSLYDVTSAQLDVSEIGADLRLRVRVVGVPRSDERRIRFDAKVIDCLDCRSEFGPRRIQLSGYEGIARNVRAGQTWQLTVRLKPLNGLQNPTGFDAVQWGIAKGFHAKGYIRKEPAPVLERQADLLSVSAMREATASRLQALSGNGRYIGLVQALSVGVKHNVADEIWRVLRETGTAHLLAISGLHISLVAAWALIVAGALVKGLRRLQPYTPQSVLLPDSHTVSLLSCGTVALAYAVLSGFELPTQRAMLMLLVWIIASWRCRFLAPAGALAMALIAVLASHSLHPLSAGFWLSFGTVWILFLLHNGWQKARGSEFGSDSSFRYRMSKLVSAARTHVLLAVILLPVSGWFFQAGSLVAPVANMLAVPWVGCLIVPLSFLAMFLSYWFPSASTMVLAVNDRALAALLYVLELLSRSNISAVTLTISDVTTLLLCLLGLACAFAPAGLGLRWLAAPLVFPVLLINIKQPPITGFEVHVLDVGQGLAVLVLTENETMLYDTGGTIIVNTDNVRRCGVALSARPGSPANRHLCGLAWRF